MGSVKVGIAINVFIPFRIMKLQHQRSTQISGAHTHTAYIFAAYILVCVERRMLRNFCARICAHVSFAAEVSCVFWRTQFCFALSEKQKNTPFANERRLQAQRRVFIYISGSFF